MICLKKYLKPSHEILKRRFVSWKIVERYLIHCGVPSTSCCCHLGRGLNSSFYETLKRLLRTLSLRKEIDSVNLAVLRTIKFSHYIRNVFVISYYLSHFLCSQAKSWIVTLSSLWMGYAMYFSLGNSNSLASVDISAGYVGLEDFVPSIMVPLTYVATYCGPCLWLMAGILSVIRNTRDAVRCVQVYLHITLSVYF